ncbi:unnamed protein product [Somion occarium]|uniref:Uncharacterized protein n=1 Tax=Somion occarium TaxID=3059160 RepID=A0ABP1ED12_9APHY
MLLVLKRQDFFHLLLDTSQLLLLLLDLSIEFGSEVQSSGCLADTLVLVNNLLLNRQSLCLEPLSRAGL